jgi:hypothetical protein
MGTVGMADSLLDVFLSAMVAVLLPVVMYGLRQQRRRLGRSRSSSKACKGMWWWLPDGHH